MSEPTPEEVEELKRVKEEQKSIMNLMLGTSASAYAVDKIIMRAEARVLIQQIEAKGEAYALDLTLSNLSSLTRAFDYEHDPFEQYDLFDHRDHDRDYLSGKDASLFMSDDADSSIDKHKSFMPNDKEELKISIKVDSKDNLDKMMRMCTVKIPHHLVEINQDIWNHDWRSDDEPVAAKADSFLSRQVPVKEELVLDFSHLNGRTLLRPGLKTIRRKMSSKLSTTSYIRKNFDKAKDHLTIQPDKVKQKKLTDLPPEENEDVNVERMRSMKQREALRRERENKEKLEKIRRNELIAKEEKANLDKLSKKNHTYDFKGSIIFVRKPNMDVMPTDFNVSKISKKSLKKEKIPPKKDDESFDETIQKYFSKKVEVVTKGKDGKVRESSKKNYKGMENK